MALIKTSTTNKMQSFWLYRISSHFILCSLSLLTPYFFLFLVINNCSFLGSAFYHKNKKQRRENVLCFLICYCEIIALYLIIASLNDIDSFIVRIRTYAVFSSINLNKIFYFFPDKNSALFYESENIVQLVSLFLIFILYSLKFSVILGKRMFTIDQGI